MWRAWRESNPRPTD